MKKIALFGLIGFVLTGCGDDKVTKEYLVGDWDCSYEEYESKYDLKFKEYDDYSLKSSEQFKQSYKIVDDVLMSKIADKNAFELDLNKVYSNLNLEGKTDNCNYSIKRDLVKKANNKFSWTEETFFDCTFDKDSMDKFKTKRERICTRIK